HIAMELDRRTLITGLSAALSTALFAARPARAALASEASGQRGHFRVRASDTRPEPGSSTRAASVTDGAGRAMPVPARVERVFPAGPPAAIMLYTLAPALLIGWPRANQPEEREFLLPDVGGRPEVGRITGRGNTANLEVVLALKPDLILDVGSMNPTYISLADRVQQQTGIPYALLDGRFEGIPLSYRTLGALIGWREQ